MPTIPWGDNKMQWNLSQNKNISLKNAFKVVIYKISAILFWALVYQSLMGKFDWGVWYVIIFLYEQFWIRLAVVNDRGKKVRTVAFPVVRSVNKLHDTRNCVQNEPEYAICVIFTTRSSYKALGLILCYLV